MAIATVEDVQAAMGRPLSTVEQAQAQYLLDYAEMILTRRIGDLTLAMADGDPTEQQITIVEVNATTRVLKNPVGAKSETAGPFQISLDTSGKAGSLYISDDDWALLGISGATGAFSIAPLYAANDPDTSWAGVYSGSPPVDLDWS